MQNSRARTRQLERHGTAAIRALSAAHNAEYRATRLKVDGQAVPYAAPYLAVNFANIDLSRSRGVADAMAARLFYSDARLHREANPESPLARVVFDILEQLRCEALVPQHLSGMRVNLDSAFTQWCLDARNGGMVESNIGILLYTVIHMIRARLINNTDDEEVAGLIEATRANISPLIGKPFYELAKMREDQAQFAPHAVAIADVIATLAGNEAESDSEIESVLERHSVVLGPDWEGQDLDTADGAGGIGGGESVMQEEALESVGDYHVFNDEFDAEVSGESLYRLAQREVLRNELDRQIAGQAVSVTRLALRLQRLFAAPENDGWLFGQDEGVLDGRRLSQLVSNPSYAQIFRKDRLQPVNDTLVSFLIDNSGSMKAQRFEAVAVLVDTYARALELAGANTEILGFTTGDWNGGRVMKAWRAAGMPADPGRLNESLHIVYKDAETPWKRARYSISSMMKTLHFRESVDGEALIWAYRRLKARSERRRILVVISDGAPLDAATHNANREGFMSDHVQSVAGFLEKHTSIELAGIGIDLDLSDFYSNSITLNLEGTLNTRIYSALEQLFSKITH